MQNIFITDEEVETKRKMIIRQLKSERNRAQKQIKKYQKSLSEAQLSLEEINKMLCNFQGHTFSSWIRRVDKLDDERLWYYERTCEICGYKETKEKNEVVEDPLLIKKNK